MLLDQLFLMVLSKCGKTCNSLRNSDFRSMEMLACTVLVFITVTAETNIEIYHQTFANIMFELSKLRC